MITKFVVKYALLLLSCAAAIFAKECIGQENLDIISLMLLGYIFMKIE